MNKQVKIFFVLGFSLLIYSFLSSIIPINFFWESKSFGWFFILLGFLIFMIGNIKERKKIKKKNIWLKIGVGFLVFIFFIQLILILIIPNTDAYKVAKKYIKESKEIESELGKVESFGIIPSGGISVSVDSYGKTGNANIDMIIKGDKKYKRITVYVFKDYDKDWEVYEID